MAHKAKVLFLFQCLFNYVINYIQKSVQEYNDRYILITCDKNGWFNSLDDIFERLYNHLMFIWQLVISFIAGGLLIAFQTFLGERVPLKWRGMVLTIPTTLALGLLFIGLIKSVHDIPEVVKIIPAALAPDYLFVLFFALFSRYSLTKAMLGGMAVWFVSAIALLRFPPSTLPISIFLYGLPVIAAAYLLISRMHQITAIAPVAITVRRTVIRSLIGGSIVVLIVVLSKFIGNSWGGVFSTFPAAFSSTFLIYYLAHGKEIIPSVGKSMFFPGAVGFMLYAITAAYSFPHFGIWMGTLIAYVITIPFYILYPIIKNEFIK